MKTRKPPNWGDTRLNVLIYSLTGAGKTHFCGTVQRCRQASPTLVVDCAGGMTTLAGQNIRIVHPANMSDIQEVYDYFRHRNWRKGSQVYKSVCLDGITGINQELIMPLVKEDGENPYEDLASRTPATRQDYLKSHEVTRRTLKAFRDLCQLDEPERRIHVVMTALEKNDERREIVCPQLPGVLGIEVGSYVDVLARLSLETVGEEDDDRLERYLLTEETLDDSGLKILAKNRGNRLGAGMWKPTMTKIIKRWTAEGGEK